MEVLNRPAVQASGVPISWTLYFPSEEFSPEDRRAELIKSLIDGFLTEKGQQLLQQADPKELSLFSRWTVSMESLKQHLQPACSTGQSDLGAAAELLLQALEAAPEEALACLGAAATEMFLERGLIEAPALPSASACASQHASSRLAVRLVDHTDSIIEFKKLKASSLGESIISADSVAILYIWSSFRLAVRLVDYKDSVIEFKKLKASSLDRLVTVCGTVVRVGPLRPLVVAMDFTCTRCGAITSLSFPDGRFSQPTACGHDNCRNRTFLQNRAGARKINFQTIRLQEPTGGTGGGEDMGRMPRVVDCELREDLADACLLQELTGGTGGGEDMGRMPRVVDCELREDLADACLPGDVVAVCGIVKIINNETDVGGGELYIDAISVVNANSQSTTPSPTATTAATATPALRSPPSAGGASGGAVELGEEDLRGILDYVVEHEGEGDLFQHLVHSFCPSIYGHVLVKAGGGGHEGHVGDGGGEEDMRSILEYVVEHEGENDLHLQPCARERWADLSILRSRLCAAIGASGGAVELGEDNMRKKVICFSTSCTPSAIPSMAMCRTKKVICVSTSCTPAAISSTAAPCFSVVRWHLQLLPSSSLLSSPLSLSLAAGIILSLFGGVRKHEGDANRVPVRGDVHALLVGDPGMGKSQLLKAAAAVAPRGVYVCGSGASSVGLTVAVVKDGPGGEYAFEAGWSGASSVGLMVAVVKDGPGGEYAFEAGRWWEGKKGEVRGVGCCSGCGTSWGVLCGSGASSVGLMVAVVKDGPGGEARAAWTR
ncbi:unnamed protein product, partial [Closterium sp. NIES-64]